jgi:hypothetical protein
MSAGLIWAWIVANEATVATLLLVLSEILGSIPQIKANGMVSFVILQIQQNLKKKGAVDPTP